MVFPHPELAEDDGLLAVGGDLSRKRLLLAYSMGIFPWYSEDSPILWWSPDPRLVLIPGELKISRSLRQTIKKGLYRITMDTAFDEVVSNCAAISRKRQQGTWITDDMMEAYRKLHEAGYAHSVESWYEGALVGGLYGVSLGRIFFGESMFAKRSDASKAAFVGLVRRLQHRDFMVIDCQMTTEHLMQFGAKEVPRKEFLRLLKGALNIPASKGVWRET